MCHFITAALPVKANHARLAEIAAGYGRAFTPLRNPHVQAQLPPDTGYFLTTAAHCDCGTVLGSAIRKPGHGGSKSLNAEEWLEFMREILNSGVKRFGLLLHWYHGAPPEEAFRITERITFKVRDGDPAVFADFAEDVLYQFI